MAGGKQSPRQKMINLMYLVFLAMMAMNMSKEVLSAFGLMKEKLEGANTRASERNAAAYESLAIKASEQAKQYGEAKEKTDKIKADADELYNFIEDLKSRMTAEIPADKKKAYEEMDKAGYLDEHFFAGGEITPAASDFIARVDNFRKNTIENTGKEDLVKVIEDRFNTDAVTDREGVKKGWLSYNFEGFPLVASLTKLTQMQADIKTTESDALSSLLEKELSAAVSMTNYDAMVLFEKSAYFPGEKLSGKIVLGKNDPNLMAEEVIINGKQWPKDKIKAGQVILDGSAGNVGDKTLTGEFKFKENDSIISIPIKGAYSVIPRPNGAVISADKMNVVYRGLPNPLTISVPGVPSNKVKASAPGLKRISGDKYMMRPGAGKEVNIRVSGGAINSTKKFRIKDIPPAVGMVRGQYGTVRMPKSSVANTTVGAGLPDFLFDLKLNVSSFKIKIPGQLTINVSGRRLNQRAKKLLTKARRGDQIVIYDIKASVSGSSYRIKKVLPVSIEITN